MIIIQELKIFIKLVVGQVTKKKLVDEEMVINAIIKDEHKNLLAQDSIFWVEDIKVNLNGVKNLSSKGMDVSLFGVKISTETINTMINGGITMVTPDEANAKAQEFEHYKLYNTLEEKWLEYAPELINNMSTCREEI